MKGDVKGIFHPTRDGEYFFAWNIQPMLVNCTPSILRRTILHVGFISIAH